MQQHRFLSTFDQICQVVPSWRLEDLLGQSGIRQERNELQFTYWVYMEPYPRPLFADEEGNVWIGKEAEGNNMIYEELGSGLSRLLGCQSPEIDYTAKDGEGYILSKFIFPLTKPSSQELSALGQTAVIPRLLVGTRASSGEEPVFRTDFNRGQFLIGPAGTFYQIDFSPHPEKNFGVRSLKGILLRMGFPEHLSTEIVSGQLAIVKQNRFEDLYREFTRRSASVIPTKTGAMAGFFEKSYTHIEETVARLETAKPL